MVLKGPGKRQKIASNPQWKFKNYIVIILPIVGRDIEIRYLNEHVETWPGSFKPVRKIHEQTMTIAGIPDR
jgi:hypothetical protein